ncbi:MAG: putative secreted protein [bacterium]|nr:MAG: putative secreted protein [bacterium]
MKIRLIAAVALSLLFAAPGLSAVAQVAELPAPGVGRAAYAPFEHLVGKTWRGVGTGPEAVEDIQRWEWAVGGHAVRVTHSVGGGAYAGETLIFRDKASGAYIYHYFTSGGFHTTGVMRPTGPGAFEAEETVHGLDGFPPIRSTLVMGADGVHHVRSFQQENGAWVEKGGFDYREDATAVPVMPVLAPVAREAAASAGPLDLTRRIVATSGAAGEDSAGYVRIRNGSPVADELVDASCVCADTIEFHRIVRTETGGSMIDDPIWTVPGNGALDVRPGTSLHFMLINFDPAKAVDGRVRLTLTFRDSGTVEADFALTGDSRAAWTAFD